MKHSARIQNLVLVLGDQLDERSAAFDDFDEKTDAVWMAEVAHESEKVWVAKPRIAIFLAAMRHFRDALRERGWRVFYRALSAKSAEWRCHFGGHCPPMAVNSRVAGDVVICMAPMVARQKTL